MTGDRQRCDFALCNEPAVAFVECDGSGTSFACENHAPADAVVTR